MNNFMFNVKQLKMNQFIKYIWQLIIITSNATLEVPRYAPVLTTKTLKILVLNIILVLRRFHF